jgi:hypothetical protein
MTEKDHWKCLTPFQQNIVELMWEHETDKISEIIPHIKVKAAYNIVASAVSEARRVVGVKGTLGLIKVGVRAGVLK